MTFQKAFARVPKDLTYTRPWVYPKQSEALFTPKDKNGDAARYSLVEATTKAGKTVGCLAWLFEMALLGGKGMKNYWWVAPIFNQADIAYRRMKSGLDPIIFKSNEQKMTISLPNGAVIWFKSGDNPDSLYGEDVYAAVIDEASRVRKEAWYAVRSTLTATRGPLRIIGNVKGRKNWFYEMARKAEHGEPGMSYHRLIAKDAVDAGVLHADEIASAKRELPEQVFNELYLAIPSDDGGNPFGLKAIEECVIPGLSGLPVVAWGWDLAKSHDWTVGTGLDKNGHTARLERFQLSWEITFERIKELTGRKPALVDSTGVGDPIVERLQKGNSNFAGYQFSSPSKQKLMEGLAVGIQKHEVGYPEGFLKDELECFEYEYTRTGVRYSAPEGYFDDGVCSLALAHMCRLQNRGAELWAALGRG